MVDHGDGTWSRAVPEGVSFATERRGPLFTERYDGQVRYSHDPQPLREARFVVRERVPRTVAEQVGDMVRVDRWGRRWVAVGVDEAALPASVVMGDGPLEDAAGSAWEPHAAEDFEEDTVGTEVTWSPDSWSNFDCNKNQGNKYMSVWGAEDRVKLFDNSLQPRQKTTVWFDEVGCTGVMIRQQFVLTAAHCFTDDNGNLRDPLGSVCRAEPGEGCVEIDDVHYDEANWGGDFMQDYKHDWMLLKLVSTWPGTGAQTMNLSGAGDATLEALNDVRNLGRPGAILNPQGVCAVLSGTSNRIYRLKESEPIANVRPEYLRMKLDRTKGQSGSPLYYCPLLPDGSPGNIQTCNANEKGYVFGVLAGWRAYPAQRTIGPKVSSFRAGAVAWMDNQ